MNEDLSRITYLIENLESDPRTYTVGYEGGGRRTLNRADGEELQRVLEERAKRELADRKA